MSIFIGENGSGKSTILEVLAYGIGLPTSYNPNIENDGSIEGCRSISTFFEIDIVYQKQTRFVFRAEPGNEESTQCHLDDYSNWG